jgi:transcription initiation factor TFIIIB Brf1 subunit/transcription initiation factor TFIIB
MPRDFDDDNSEEYCPNCGQYTEGEPVCPNCGAVLKDSQQDEMDGFHETDGDDADDDF